MPNGTIDTSKGKTEVETMNSQNATDANSENKENAEMAREVQN